jgi:hypothetical protein
MTRTHNSLELLITPERLAYLLGVEVGTLAMWRRRGIGPKWYHIGRQIRYSETAALEWLQAQAVRACKFRDQPESAAATADSPIPESVARRVFERMTVGVGDGQ